MPRQLLNETNIPTKYQDPTLAKRRAVLSDTVQKLELGQDDYKEKARKNHARWKESCADHQKAIHRIEVKQSDWGTVTQALSAATGEIYAVLNMANAYVPGGGYLEGMVAQEENMFRRTDCHFYVEDQHMDDEKSRYSPEMG